MKEVVLNQDIPMTTKNPFKVKIHQIGNIHLLEHIAEMNINKEENLEIKIEEFQENTNRLNQLSKKE